MIRSRGGDHGVGDTPPLVGVTSPDFDDLGRAEALAHVSGAVAFLGMGLLLGGIVMHLVNVWR